MMELAMKQKTAPNRMGSHSALSSVMRISLILVILSDAAHSAADSLIEQPLANRRGVAVRTFSRQCTSLWQVAASAKVCFSLP